MKVRLFCAVFGVVIGYFETKWEMLIVGWDIYSAIWC